MSLASRLIKAIFANEAGDLTAANSPAATDNSKRLATTEWAKLGFTLSTGTFGYIKFPTWLGGLVIQWGQVTAAASNGATGTTVSFATPFPNGSYQNVMTDPGPSCFAFSSLPLTATQFRVWSKSDTGNYADGTGRYIAIGN